MAQYVGVYLLIAGLGAAYFFPLPMVKELDLEPSLHWPDPVFVNEPHPLDGPVLVTVDYRIDPARVDDFVAAMREVKRILQRDGAVRWGLFVDSGLRGRLFLPIANGQGA